MIHERIYTDGGRTLRSREPSKHAPRTLESSWKMILRQEIELFVKDGEGGLVEVRLRLVEVLAIPWKDL